MRPRVKMPPYTPDHKRLLEYADFIRGTDIYHDIITRFAELNDSIVVGQSENSHVEFYINPQKEGDENSSYTLKLPQQISIHDVVETISHIESVTDKLPINVSSINNAHMLIAGSKLIRESVVPITKDPQGYSQLADAMEFYGEKMRSEVPEEMRSELEPEPSEEEVVEWLVGKKDYTRLFNSYCRINNIDPSTAPLTKSFTQYLTEHFARTLTQPVGIKAEVGMQHVSLSRERDVMSALHMRGKRELVTKLFARTSKERRGDLLAKRGALNKIGRVLDPEEQKEFEFLQSMSDGKLNKELKQSIKDKTHFAEAKSEIDEQLSRNEHTIDPVELEQLATLQEAQARKLYTEVTRFPHKDNAGTPKQALNERLLNCSAKTQLLGELYQDLGLCVYAVTIPRHTFLVIEFANGKYSTYDANGGGIINNVFDFPQNFLKKQLGDDINPTALAYVPLPLNDHLEHTYGQIIVQASVKYAGVNPSPLFGTITRFHESTMYDLLRHYTPSKEIDVDDSLILWEQTLQESPQSYRIRYFLIDKYLKAENAASAKRLIHEDNAYHTLTQQDKYDFTKRIFLIDKDYSGYFDMIRNEKTAQDFEWGRSTIVYRLMNSHQKGEPIGPFIPLLRTILNIGYERITEKSDPEAEELYLEIINQIHTGGEIIQLLSSVGEFDEKEVNRHLEILENHIRTTFASGAKELDESQYLNCEADLDIALMRLTEKLHEQKLP